VVGAAYLREKSSMARRLLAVECMRFGVRFVAVVLMTAGLGTSAVAPPAAERYRPTKSQYVRRTFSPGAVARAGVGAAVGQARNSPREWGQGAAGFGKRWSSAFGSHVVKNSIQFPVASLRHEALGYQPSHKHGFGPRLGYALESTVITHRTNTGRRTIAAGEISGAVGSGLISRLWQPARLHTLASGFSSAGITLGADAGLNVAREFWPRHSPARSHAAVRPRQPSP
jgi:hypothetical protein